MTIFFAVARRRPIPGMITGALIGTLQDAWTGHPIGLFGIAKTIVGYLGSSIGVKLDVENPGSRFLMTFAFVLIHRFVYMAISLQLVGGSEAWSWGHTMLSALVNGSGRGCAVRLAGQAQAEELIILSLRSKPPECMHLR